MTTIPDTHQDLLTQQTVVTLATVQADGQPHLTAIWCGYDGSHIWFITSRGVQKEKNMQRNPKVSIMALDHQNPYRYLEARGQVAEITEVGAMEKLDELTQRYTGKPTYYGHIIPAEDEGKRTHVICKIRPKKILTRG